MKPIGAAPNASTAVGGMPDHDFSPYSGSNITSHPFLQHHPTNSLLVDMHGGGEKGNYRMVPDSGMLQHTMSNKLPAGASFDGEESIPDIAKEMGPKTNSVYNIFSEACNREGGASPADWRQSFPNATNVTMTPPMYYGSKLNSYSNNNYTNASVSTLIPGEKLVDMTHDMTPVSTTHDYGGTNALPGSNKFFEEPFNGYKHVSPPNMYRWDGINQFTNAGAYNPDEIPNSLTNGYHDDLGPQRSVVYRKILNLIRNNRTAQ